MDAATPDSVTTRAERFNIRVTQQEKSMVEQAARASRVSVSQFILQAAVRSAEEVLAQQTAFVLSPEQWDAFAERLDKPARVLPQLERAARESDVFGGR